MVCPLLGGEIRCRIGYINPAIIGGGEWSIIMPLEERKKAEMPERQLGCAGFWIERAIYILKVIAGGIGWHLHRRGYTNSRKVGEAKIENIE